MTLPSNLQSAIEAELDRIGRQKIARASDELSERYRQPGSKTAYMSTEAHRGAYLAARMPATYAAVSKVLNEVKRRIADMQIKTILDLGAGPGTVMWAAAEIFPEIEGMTLIEYDADLISLGKRLANAENHLFTVQWTKADLSQLKSFTPHDLVICSYSIGELSEADRQALIQSAWAAAGKLLVIIEPGTPVGFERIRQLRSNVIAMGGNMVAPCPHILSCPMANGDWCHFSARLERSVTHRQVKAGTLGYEDEKFSYVALSKTICEPLPDRILRHPLKRSGHVHFTLCTKEGLKNQIISKRDGELYKRARDLEWGDGINQETVDRRQ